MAVKRERTEPPSRKRRQGNEGTEDVTRGLPQANEFLGDKERRFLRSRYRELKVSLADKGELVQYSSTDFNSLIDEIDDIHVHVERPREQIADAELFLEITNGILDVARGARCKNGMSAAEFVGAISRHFGSSTTTGGDTVARIDWNLIGLETCGIFGRASGVSTMLGPMEIEVKQRKAQGIRKRDKSAPKTRPEQVEDVDAELISTETDANMTSMFAVLAERGCVELDRLVLNRRSFSQSVENLFCLSFLVKEGRAEIKIGNRNHIVAPRNAPTHNERGSGQHNRQFVFRYDFKDWMTMKETVEEGMEVMPDRTKVQESALLIRTSRTPIRKTSRNRARETPMKEQNSDADAEPDEAIRPRKRRALMDNLCD